MNYLQKKINVPQTDGTFKRKTVYAKNKNELNDKVKKILAEAEREVEKQLNPTFSEIADLWNEIHEKEIEYNTYQSYQAPLNDLKAAFGDRLIKEITPMDIQLFLNRMFSQGYAKQTISLRKIVAKLIFDYAIMENKISVNPVLSVKVPRNAKKNERNLPTEKEIEIIKKSVDLPFGLFPYLILFTGLRKGEAAALMYEDIDFENNLIHISKSVYYKNSKPYIKATKTKNGIRTIPLLYPLKNVLDENKKGYIFNKGGKLLTRSQITKYWYKYTDIAGVNVTAHQLRHAFATICFDADITAKDASKLLGHSKIETTMDIYTHIRESRNSVNAAKLNKYLAE